MVVWSLRRRSTLGGRRPSPFTSSHCSHHHPLSVGLVLDGGVFRDVRLVLAAPGGLSMEGPSHPEPFGLQGSRAATDVS